ncbi:MAG: hypothetical protein ABR569_14420 [Gaiellaceae bacterium]
MKRRLILAGVLTAVALSSCGGGSDTKGEPKKGSARAPSRQEFIKQGDTICRAGVRTARRQTKHINAVTNRATDAETLLADLEPLFREGLQDQRATVRKFERLTPPRGEEKQFQKMLAYFKEQAALLSRLVEAADRRDAAGFTAAGKEQRHLGAEVGMFLRGYGFTACGGI